MSLQIFRFDDGTASCGDTAIVRWIELVYVPLILGQNCTLTRPIWLNRGWNGTYIDTHPQTITSRGQIPSSFTPGLRRAAGTNLHLLLFGCILTILRCLVGFSFLIIHLVSERLSLDDFHMNI